MVDTATTRKRFRKQETGTNNNTWGTKLNEVLDAIDQCIDGYESLALTADYTLVTTNYTTADEAKYRVIKFTGSAGAVAVTFPSVQGWYIIVNTNSGTVTCKCSGGTGVAVPTNYIALIYGDGTDMRNGAPQLFAGDLTSTGAITLAGQIHGLVAGTAATDGVNKTQLEAAIAAASGLTSPFILNSANDTTAGYLGQKVAGTGFIVKSTTSPSGNEVSSFASDDGQIALYAEAFS